MPNLILHAVIVIALNIFLICSIPTGSGWGAGWSGSPMGRIGSRLVYSRSQIPWHNGVDEDYTKRFIHLDINAIPDYFDAVYAGTKPTPEFAHLSHSNLEELSKNLIVVKMMRLSLDWDPSNYQTAYDLSFLLRAEIHHPELSLQVLDETLSHDLPDYGRLLLDVEKFQLLRIHMQRREDARLIVPEIQKLTSKCSDLEPTPEITSLLENARAIPIIVQNDVTQSASQKITPTHTASPNHHHRQRPTP